MPTNTASHTEGTIVAWDYDLAMTGKYTMRLNSSTGPQGVWSINLRGIDFGGNSYDPDKVCVVGANTLGTNANLNYSFMYKFLKCLTTIKKLLTTSLNFVVSVYITE